MSKIVLWVSDLDAQIDFYSRLFNVTDVYRDGGFADVTDGTNSVLLHKLPDEYSAATPLTAQLKTQDEVAIKPVFTVVSIADAKERVAHTFGSFSEQSNSYGAFTYQDAIDPEGNVIQLQQAN
jgi:catechol 2,3-dioxygenase-like lactoylglutathione lyase family enzyme